MTDTRQALAALLPCPFCGNSDGLAVANENPHDLSGGYFIACPSCDASTGLRFACGEDPTPLLIEQWNRRAALSAQPVAGAVAQRSDAEILVLADKLFPMWREDIQPQFVLRIARAVLADATQAAPAQPVATEASKEIQELRAQVEAWRKQCDTLTHQVICCGVAATHPDATLTTRGAYAGKWNSRQAEEVRKLRAERDALLAAPQPQSAPAPEPICQPNGLMFDALGEPRTRYVRVSLHGSHCVMHPSEGDTYLKDARENGDESPYVADNVWLSEREFDNLGEFDGF